MKTQKVSNFDVIPPKKAAFMIETPPDMIKAHFLLVASGRRGGGKSVAVSNLCRKLMEDQVFDKVILISPTYYSNKEIFDPLDIKEPDIYEPEANVIKAVIHNVEQEKQEWDAFNEKLEKWKMFEKLIKSRTPIHEIDPGLLIELMELGFLDVKPQRPVWKYKQERPPRMALIIDDCMGTPLMNPKSGLTNLAIKHRHICKGLGISIAMLVQSYCAVGGLPRPIRENCTCLLLFRNTQTAQIQKIYDEVGGGNEDLTFEQFEQMFKYATDKPFGFLLIDFSPKEPHKRFRANYNEYLLLKTEDTT